MAAPLSAVALLAALRAEGVRVVEVDDWRTHNRNHKGGWGPMNGVMIHHTVTKGTAHTVALCRDGHSALPGPLCHGVIAKDGRVHMVGWGRANHAGLGDDDVLQAVIDERALPADNEANTDGNRHFYGFECENLGDGKDPWSAAQLEAIERVSAAICRAHGWNARSVIGHLEWQPGKVDPRGFSMNGMRDRAATRLAHPAGWDSPSSTDPSKEDDMPTPADVWKADVIPAASPPYNNADWKSGNKSWSAGYALGTVVLTGRKTEAKVTALTAQVAALAAAIQALAKDGGLPLAQVQAAAEAGAQAALDKLADKLQED